MRILIEKERNGQRLVTVVPGKRAKLAPVSIRGQSKAAVMEEVATTVAAVERAEAGSEVVPNS